MTITTILIIVIISFLIQLFLTWKSRNPAEPKGLEDVMREVKNVITELPKIQTSIRDEFAKNREENIKSSRSDREELGNSFKSLSEAIEKTLKDISKLQEDQLSTFSNRLNTLTDSNEGKMEKLIESNRKEITLIKDQVDSSLKSIENKNEQSNKGIEEKLEKIRTNVESKLHFLQEENNKKLDEMRATVDEKLQSTLDKRFNESFNIISERLEQVHKGLGEMQSLATGVGDLKKVLTNVKSRGTFAEVQLGAILEQFLSPQQYELNVAVKAGSQERVEYAIKLPSKNDDDKAVLLPIDSKFPTEDFQRLSEATDNSSNQNLDEIKTLSKAFENSVKKNGKDISERYINSPITTDFAIMFVPTEGLYAEIARRRGLVEFLQKEYKVVVVGPTNLVAFLNSLQMGFRTLAIEKRSSEVWELLGAVKTKFGEFGNILEKTKKKLQEAANTIDDASVQSRSIEKKLRNVQELPSNHTASLIENGTSVDNEVLPSSLLFTEK